jgi:hypothetical protein
MNMQYMTRMCAAAVLAMASSTGALAVEDSQSGIRADFTHGQRGWQGPAGGAGSTFVDTAIGAAPPALHTQFYDFGIEFYNTRKSWLQGLAQPGAVDIGLKTNTYSIFFFSREVTRQIAVEIRDHHNPPAGYQYVSVWAPIGTLDSSRTGWRSMRIQIPDTQSTTLPTGWGGTGAEDPVTYGPVLPPGRTFASVLANADEISFTTLIPGWFFDMASFDVAIDDVFVRSATQP